MENNRELFDLYSTILTNYHKDLFQAKDKNVRELCQSLIDNNNVQICEYPNLYDGVVDSLRSKIAQDKDCGKNYYFRTEALYSLQVEHFSQFLVSLSKKQESISDDKSLYDEFGNEMTKICSSIDEKQAQDVMRNLNNKVERIGEDEENEDFVALTGALKFLNDITENNQESGQEQ